MLAYIVGNGLTREAFDIKDIKDNGIGPYSKGPIFACNAAYRNFPDQIDYLIALDNKIISEINASDFPKNKFIVPALDEQYEDIRYSPNRHRNNAAMVAMKEAIKMGYTNLICLGLDFVIDDKELNIGNLYDGTNGYEMVTRASYFDTISRCRYMKWFAKQNKQITFTFLFPKEYNFRIEEENISIEVLDE